jgi:HEPN domain-containing protein
LAKACEGLGESLAPLKADMEFLDRFYVPARYPDAPVSALPEGNPTPDVAERALAAGRRVCDLVTAALKRRA